MWVGAIEDEVCGRKHTGSTQIGVFRAIGHQNRVKSCRNVTAFLVLARRASMGDITCLREDDKSLRVVVPELDVMIDGDRAEWETNCSGRTV